MKQLGESGKAGVILAGIGLLLMGYGISRGEMTVVFQKAVRICLECVGIG